MIRNLYFEYSNVQPNVKKCFLCCKSIETAINMHTYRNLNGTKSYILSYQSYYYVCDQEEYNRCIINI